MVWSHFGGHFVTFKLNCVKLQTVLKLHGSWYVTKTVTCPHVYKCMQHMTVQYTTLNITHAE